MRESYEEENLQGIESLSRLPISGITPFTTIDFPGRLAAVFYTQGCPWRCRYCFNEELQPFDRYDQVIPSKKIAWFLKTRRAFLDAIVFSGGEATSHEMLREWMEFVKSIGFAVGLHTAGIHPDNLEKVLPSCDWVGLDVKAPFEDYEKITQIKQSGERVKQSLKVILESGIDCEFRTTVHPELLGEKDILNIATDISLMGAKKYVIQIFKALPKINLTSCGDWSLSEKLKKHLETIFPVFEIRL
jgi:pyruvate formate lyase activating enzyme